MATVLIIDDDPICRTNLRCVLELLGHTVFEAESSRAATDLYRQLLTDLIMLDMHMPDRDGFETLFFLRDIRREARIIMMTEGGTITLHLYQQMARSLRMPELLTKPFSAEAVASAVTNTLDSDKRDGIGILQGESPQNDFTGVEPPALINPQSPLPFER